jgi:hypothetical protein
VSNELIESYLACSSDTVVVQVGNVIHKGTRAMGFINGVDEKVISS